MKRIFNIFLVVAVVAGVLSCKEQYTIYDDAEYIIFADTLSTNMVLNDGKPFKVSVSSTVARDYDRTLAVEVIDKGSNAIEGRHYRLGSNTIVIPAGERSADVLVYGNYDNIEPTDSLGFILQLVMPDQLKWDLYSEYNRTQVVMYKSCPFDINDWAGTEAKPRYCMITSLLLNSYPGLNKDYSRLVECVKHPSLENVVIMKGLFYDGYDVNLTFHTENPAMPRLSMRSGQVLSDEATVFGQILGDNKILGESSPLYESSFNSCQAYAQLWVHVYVNNMSTTVGTVGHFYNILEWISDEEADEMRREGY